ncbi:MAG: tetratricopeptide repeat protein [Rubricoccaceae bacterium]
MSLEPRPDLEGGPSGGDAPRAEPLLSAAESARAKSAEALPPAPADPYAPRVCDACGHANPPAARFCNQCGSALPMMAQSELRRAGGPAPARPRRLPAAGGERPASDVGRRAFALIGAGLTVVVLLFFVSSWSANRVASGAAAGPVAEGAPAASPAVSPAVPAQPLPDSLRARAEAFEAEGSAVALFEAGRIYLTAAFDAPEEADRPVWARRALEAFERSLALEPNPDARVALAEAARMGGDPTNPMRAVEELQRVLGENPDHVGANFVMADLRATIGRLDGAEELFRRVVELTPPSDPVHQRALQNLELVRAEKMRVARQAQGG